VTAAQILATAAMLDGFEVRGLDQTGLSQKAGPVVSDLRLTRDTPSPSNLLMQQSADVLIGFDLLVAASDKALEVATDAKTILVASETPTPTGAMIGNPLESLPTVESLLERLANRIAGESSYLVDAGRYCTDLLGSVTSSNIFILGVSVQLGVLPVSPESFMKAIELNNVNVQGNLAAFHWGRTWAFDSEYVNQLIQEKRKKKDEREQVRLHADFIKRIDEFDLSTEGSQLVQFLANDVLGFQNYKTVDQFLTLLEQANCETKKLSGRDDRETLIIAIARNSHKLITYKDEYEVARLFLSPGLESEINQLPQSKGAKRAVWHLHPPFLRALGMRKKLKVPYAIALPLMKLLSKGKLLRGTKLDFFGYAKVRKMERQIRDQYLKQISQSLGSLTDNNFNEFLDLACLPDAVRGFEDIKMRKAKDFLHDLESYSLADRV
jgi:indolepyruvate ferredoxin oxidoreductase